MIANNKFHWLLLLSTLFLSGASYSQNKVSGTFKDSVSGPLDLLKVIAKKELNIVSGSYSDSLGYFEFELPNGIYDIIGISPFGDTVYNRSKVSINRDENLGEIYLAIDYNSMDEVLVAARRKLIVRKPDRLVFNVEYSINASGGSLLDALRVTPGVRVRDNSIEIIGKSSASIMIGERPVKLSGADLITFLASMSGADVQSIEVITNPPANFDAEGNSGIINIIFKQWKRSGTSGSIRTSYAQATYPGASIGGNFNTYKNKFLLFANANTGAGAIRPTNELEFYYPTLTWKEQVVSKSSHKYLNGRIGGEYQFNDHSRIGLQYIGSVSLPEGFDNHFVQLSDPSLNTLDSTISTMVNTTSKTTDQFFNLYYSNTLDSTGKKISISGDFVDYHNSTDRSFDGRSFNNNSSEISHTAALNSVDGSIKLATGQFDFELPLESVNLSFGAKTTYIQNKSDVDYYNLGSGQAILDSSNSSEFTYKESTQALYGNALLEKEKWQFQFGLRAEYTGTKGISANTVVSNDYVQLFPTAYFVYAPTDTHVFVLNYGRRIDRPPYWRLNPFRQYYNAYSYAEGNPYLRPAYYNNFEFSYTYNDILISSIYYYLGENRYDQLTLVQPNSVNQVTVQRNFLTTHSIGLGQTYVYDQLDWWESTFEAIFYYNYSESKEPATFANRKGWSTYLGTYNSFVLNKNRTLLGEVNYYYQFPEIDGVDLLKSYSSLDIGIRVKLMKGKLNVSARVVDVLRTDVIRIETRINGVEQYSNRYWDARQFVAAVSYAFGNGKRSSQTITSSSEEKQRTQN